MASDPFLDRSESIAALHHLTGVSRRRTSWLSLDHHDVFVRDDGDVRLSDDKSPVRDGRLVARLMRDGPTYAIEAKDGARLWVNRKLVPRATLTHGDMIEFEEHGPLSRFERIGDRHPLRRSVPDIANDAIGYLRTSRQPLLRRLRRAAQTFAAEFATETTYAFRAAVIVALVLVAIFAYRQGGEIDALEGSLREAQLQRERIAASLVDAERRAITPADLTALREEVAGRLSTQRERLTALEARGDAAATVVARTEPAIAFIQGGWGFRDKESGRMLRQAVDEDGRPIVNLFGTPHLTLEGDGPVVERNFTGTGFLLAQQDAVLTNRHVAIPWEDDASAIASEESPLEAVMIRFIGYFSGTAEAIELTVLAVSDTSDLALLSAGHPWPDVQGLALSAEPPAPGTDLVAMGYPTGLRSLLARTSPAFLAELRAQEGIDFWTMGERVADAGGITPLASRGIVAQSAPDALLFDAETTHGGSGGPLMDLSGAVIGIQSAIIPDFGGSNIAIPAARIREFVSTANGGS